MRYSTTIGTQQFTGVTVTDINGFYAARLAAGLAWTVAFDPSTSPDPATQAIPVLYRYVGPVAGGSLVTLNHSLFTDVVALEVTVKGVLPGLHGAVRHPRPPRRGGAHADRRRHRRRRAPAGGHVRRDQHDERRWRADRHVRQRAAPDQPDARRQAPAATPTPAGGEHRDPAGELLCRAVADQALRRARPRCDLARRPP